MIKLHFFYFPAPCKTTTYDAGILKFKQNPYGVWHNESKTNRTSFNRTVAMYYTTSDVTTYTEARLIDFSGFVSAVGMCKTDNVKVAKCRVGGDGNGSVIEGYCVILTTQQTNPIEVSEVQFLSQNKTYR